MRRVRCDFVVGLLLATRAGIRGRGSSRLALRCWVRDALRPGPDAVRRAGRGAEEGRGWSTPDSGKPGCPVSAVRLGERRLSLRVGGRCASVLALPPESFPRSGLALRRARLDRLSQSAQREPRLSLGGAASRMSKARMPRCGAGSGTNPPVFSGRNTGKSLKPPPVVGPADEDGKRLVGMSAGITCPGATAVCLRDDVVGEGVDGSPARTRRSRRCGARAVSSTVSSWRGRPDARQTRFPELPGLARVAPRLAASGVGKDSGPIPPRSSRKTRPPPQPATAHPTAVSDRLWSAWRTSRLRQRR
jgi:hypothetical protein